MREIKKNYLKILRIEIEDLKADIEFLIRESGKERESEQLSNYVFWENLTVFRNELSGVNSFFRVLDETDPDRFETLDEMIMYIQSSFKRKIKEYGIAEEINLYVGRKLMKVKQYVTVGKS
jgi:hypothetical protein